MHLDMRESITLAPFEGKVIAITGAASGIGRAAAILLAERGALLSLADVSEAGLASVRDKIERNVPAPANATKRSRSHSILTQVVDVRSHEQCTAWIARTVAHFGQPLAGAANMAGVFGPSIGREAGAIRNITDDEFD